MLRLFVLLYNKIMLKPPNKLVVIAHPDDESLFFSSVLQRSAPGSVQVLCVTNGGADGRAAARSREFAKACVAQGVPRSAIFQWDFPDIYEQRLDLDRLESELRNHLKGSPSIKQIFTHSPVGDYGHPHHQDIAFVVSKVCSQHLKVWHVAYNCRPQKIVSLTESEFALKCRVLTKIYGIETQRFLNLLPCTAIEGFSEVEFSEVKTIYQFFEQAGRPGPAKSLNLGKLKIYRGVADFLKQFGSRALPRPF